MTKKQLISKLFDAGKAVGMEDMEVFIQGKKELDLRVFKGEIDKYSIADEVGLSFRGVYRGKMGYAYTEKIDDTSIDMLVDEAVSNAISIDSEDEERILSGSDEYRDINVYNQNMEKIAPEEKINLIKNLEKEAYSLDHRVKSVNYCMYGEETIDNILVNTKGLDLESKANIAYGYISVLVKDGEDIKTSGKHILTNDFSKFNPKTLAKKAVDEAISLLGASSIKSKSYKVILRNDVVASILESFISIFSAENVQKDLSLLKGKINQKVSSDLISIIDDPFMIEGVATKSFDGEGIATRYKKIVDKGTLKTYLHNSKTAKKEGIESTGNAFKGSYKSPVTIAPTNMYIENGSVDFDIMIENLEKGLLIIDVQGLHSGLNPVSGDFSLSAYGYEVENGKVTRPVNQITIAGNFFQMLMDVEEVANDLEFILPSGSGYIGAPSLGIKSLSVSGE